MQICAIAVGFKYRQTARITGNQTAQEARRMLEQCEGSVRDALAQNEPEDYQYKTGTLSL